MKTVSTLACYSITLMFFIKTSIEVSQGLYFNTQKYSVCTYHFVTESLKMCTEGSSLIKVILFIASSG